MSPMTANCKPTQRRAGFAVQKGILASTGHPTACDPRVRNRCGVSRVAGLLRSPGVLLASHFQRTPSRDSFRPKMASAVSNPRSGNDGLWRTFSDSALPGAGPPADSFKTSTEESLAGP